MDGSYTVNKNCAVGVTPFLDVRKKGWVRTGSGQPLGWE